MTFCKKMINIKEYIYDLCLFKCGAFYIAINDDADILSELFGFKIIQFGNLDKVGFPINSLDKYLICLEEMNITYIVYDNFNMVKWYSYE